MPRCLTALFFFLPLLLSAQEKFITYPNDPIKVKEYHLKNGLTILLSENHDIPQVFGAIVVRTGGKKDPANNTGMAHYLEHMLFKGTTELGTIDYEKEKILLEEINRLYDELGKATDPAKRKEIQAKINEVSVKAADYAIPNEMDRMLSEIGGENVNAFTTEEITVYYNSFPANQMKRWLDVYAHRFENPVFRLFQSELETVYEEKNRGMDDPLEYVFEKYIERFYKVHPYGQQTVLGKTEHLKNPSLTAMYDYFRTYYVANNMALVISGDFNAEEILPVIEEKFGDWRSADVPVFPEYKEEEFKGKEVVKLRATPIKAGAIGYRAPKNNHADSEALQVLLGMLSNEGRSGLLDQLTIEGKLMTATAMPFISNDYGAAFIIFIPKIVGQSFRKAENIVNAQVEKIKSGNFDNDLFDATKLSLLKDFQTSWEDNESRALMMGTSFMQEITWGEFLKQEEKIRKVTREDVIRVANKYFGENKLVLNSKIGFPKKEKLEKPGFQPVIPKKEEHSSYYTKWKQIPEDAATPRFVDFKNDILTTNLTDKITLKQVKNPFNDIFSLKIQFGTGKYYLPLAKYLPSYLEIADSKNHTAADLKLKLFQLGCSMYTYVSEHEFTIYLSGLEQNFDKAISMIHDHLTTIKADESKVKKIIHDAEAEMKINKRQPGYISQALNHYVLFRDQSMYLRELSLNDLKKHKANEFTSVLNEIMQYEKSIQYVGKKEQSELKEIFKKNFASAAPANAKKSRPEFDKKLDKENMIYVYHDKKAVQSQLYFYIDGRPFRYEDMPVIRAFNKYFGGDMSSLVFQEIREFRSLAYSTYATYSAPIREGRTCTFSAYIGCQSDKSVDAIKAMLELIHEMPEKPERWESLQSSLIQSALAERPSFREIIQTVENWQERGYTQDPNAVNVEAYKSLTFGKVLEFYKTDLRKRPVTITIVGNTESFPIKQLESIGKIIYVKENQVLKP
jgi:zinc protease